MRFIDFSQEAITTILEFNDLISLKLFHIVLIVGSLLRMITLVQHVAVVDSCRAVQHLDLVLLFLLLLCFDGSLMITH